jgi:hypothetical protein
MSERPEARLNDPDLEALEGSLRRLAPRPAGVHRDRLMFRAGQAAASGRWPWPLATVLSSVLAAVLGVALLTRPAPSTIERVRYVVVPATEPEPPSPTDEPAPEPEIDRIRDGRRGPLPRYRRMQEQILYWGHDGLPEPPATTTPAPPSANALWQSL